MTLIPGSPSSRPPAPGTVQETHPEQSRPASATLRKTTLPESLLTVALEAPLERGPRVTARFLIRELGFIQPELAVGICLRLPSAVGQVLGQAGGRAPALPWIESESPLTVREASFGNPLRLFSASALERVFDLDAHGSTLHVARHSPAGPHESELGFPTQQQEQDFLELAVRVVSRCVALSQREGQLAEEQERLRTQMVQADKLAALGQITTSIMHELNNPLTSILAYTDYLRRRMQARIEAGEDARDELTKLERITESTERITQFAEDLVNHARPGREVVARVSLLEVIEKALSFCDHELARHNVVLERRLESATPFVRGIASQLVQIFVNLVTNAIHAASEGGHEIVVHAQSEEDWGLVCISDNGRGIASEDLERIFEPFFTTKPAGQGTGLGLAIVQELVSRHDGLISVESAPGRGAAFVVRLPTA